ncbi:MAG TPA: Ldh family oxidoreductase [Thermomicrobiales bacterium]
MSATTTASTENRARIPVQSLIDFTVRAFLRVGLTQADAETMADVLIGADIRGIDSHGAPRMRMYVERLRDGLTNPEPRIATVSETPGTLVLDGNNGSGPIVGRYAMQRCIEKARENGVATVTMRNSNHYGSLYYYPLMAVAEQMAGMTMTTTGPFIVPTFGSAGILGTNPLCIAFPGGDRERPFMIDMSTSVVAGGKLEIARREHHDIPSGWALDENLQPTTDPFKAKFLNPLGGDRDHGSQKGYGLNVAVDLFAGLLSGGKVSAENTQIERTAKATHTAHMFSAWRIDAFVPWEQYTARFDEYMQMLHDCPPAPGHERVLTPGEPEWAAEDDRRANGIPLHPAVVADLQQLADELDVPFV